MRADWCPGVGRARRQPRKLGHETRQPSVRCVGRSYLRLGAPLFALTVWGSMGYKSGPLAGEAVGAT